MGGMMPPQYWVVCINEGLVGFARAHYLHQAVQIALSILTILDVPPQTVWLYPIGPRLFTTEKIETGDA